MRGAKAAIAGVLFAVLAAGAIGAVVWGWGLRDDGAAEATEQVIPESAITLPPAAIESVTEPQPIGAELDEEAGTPWGQLGLGPGRRAVAIESELAPPFRELWSVDAGSPILYPPVVGLGFVYVVTSTGRALAVSVDTGTIGWEGELGSCVQASPALLDDLLYVALMDEPPCRRKEPNARGALVALDAASGEERWRFDDVDLVESSPLVANGRIVVGSWDGRVLALDARTGDQLWEYETGDRIRGGQAFVRGTVVAASLDATVTALAADTGESRWQATVAAPVVATPAIADGRVVVGDTGGTVYAFAVETGDLLWSRDIGDRIEAPVAIGPDAVLVGTYEGTLVALDPESGDVRWTEDLEAPILGQASVLGPNVSVATLANQTHVLATASGDRLWEFPDGRRSALLVDDERAYLAGSRTVYALVPDVVPDVVPGTTGTDEPDPAETVGTAGPETESQTTDGEREPVPDETVDVATGETAPGTGTGTEPG